MSRWFSYPTNALKILNDDRRNVNFVRNHSRLLFCFDFHQTADSNLSTLLRSHGQLNFTFKTDRWSCNGVQHFQVIRIPERAKIRKKHGKQAANRHKSTSDYLDIRLLLFTSAHRFRVSYYSARVRNHHGLEHVHADSRIRSGYTCYYSITGVMPASTMRL